MNPSRHGPVETCCPEAGFSTASLGCAMARNFSTVRELVYWEYAKLISEKAVGDRLNYKFANFTFRKLVDGKATPSSILTENQQLFMLSLIHI